MTARCCWLAALGLALASASPATCAEARTDRFGDPLPDGAVARMGTVRFRHTGDIRLVNFLPDGETIVSIGLDAVRWWEAATGKEIRRRAGPSGLGWAVALSPDRRALAVNVGDDVVAWDAITGKELWKLERPDRLLLGIAFSPDRKLVATCGERIRLWDATTGEFVRDMEASSVPVETAVFLPNARTIVSTDRQGMLRWWDVETGKLVSEIDARKSTPYWVAASPDGKRLATTGGDDVLRLWDANQKLELFRTPAAAPDHQAGCLAFSPGGKVLAAGCCDGVIRLYDAATGDELRHWQGHRETVWSLAFSPNGKTLVSGGADCAVRQWDISTGNEFHPFAGLWGQVEALAVSPDGTTVASAGKDRRVHLWNAVTGEERRSLDGSRGDVVQFLGFASAGRTVTAIYGGRGFVRPWDVVRVWDAADGKELRSFSLADKGYPKASALSPDASVVAASNEWRDRIALFDVATGEIIHEHQEAGPGWLQAGAFLGAGKTLAVFHHPAGQQSTADAFLLWNVGTGGRQLAPVRGDAAPGGSDCIASPDGKFLAVPSGDGTVELWNATTGDLIRGWSAAGSFFVLATAFSTDGRMLATTDLDGAVSLWETASGSKRGLLRCGQGLVEAIVFSADGRRVYTGGCNGTVLAWDLTGQRGAGSPPPDLDDKALEKRWDELAGEDATKAYQAVWALAAVPERSVPFLKGRLRQTFATPRQIAGWIADLDSDDFDTREKASAELHRQGGAAESALTTTLAAKPSPEAQRRIKELLEPLNWERKNLHPSDLRLVRALETLEDIDTPAARDVLSDLADGPDTALGREAKASLERLRRRSPEK